MHKENRLKILVTGASGFVGSHLVENLVYQGHDVLGTVRNKKKCSEISPVNLRFTTVMDINGSTDWSACLDGIDCVVHLANRAHKIDEQDNNALTLYRAINKEGTLQLARQAAMLGVKRFIFISSIKVNGESTPPGKQFTPHDKHKPNDPYGLSKYEAELGLREIESQTGMEVVIIRPPLIYGPGVKANFLKMIQAVHRRIPLPFGNINNQRSLLGIENLLDFISLCMVHQKAAGQTFLVSDGNDISTTELFKEIAMAMHSSLYLLPISEIVLKNILILLGCRHISEKLCDSLQLDISLARTLLEWDPPYTLNDQLTKTIAHYLLTSTDKEL